MFKPKRIGNVWQLLIVMTICGVLFGCLPMAARADVGSSAIGTGSVTYDSISWDRSYSYYSIDYSGAGYCSFGPDWISASAKIGSGTMSGTITTTDSFSYIGYLTISSLSVTGGAMATAYISIAGLSASGTAQCFTILNNEGFFPASVTNTADYGMTDSDQTPLSANWTNVDTFPSATKYLYNVTSASANGG